MKLKSKISYFLSGVLTTLLFIGCLTPVFAASAAKMIEVQTGVNIYVNDVKLNAKNANGNVVEPFIYNGTTYLPLRAVSEALDIPVQWDGKTNSVYLGKTAEVTQYLMKICPPYQTPDSQYYKQMDVMKMAGNTYTNGFALQDSGFAVFNLNGKYNSMQFTLGHIDETTLIDGTFRIYLDDQLVKEVEISCDDLPKTFSVSLNGALKMRIEQVDPTYGYQAGEWYGFANITVD